jgi:hypothetical protein
MFWFLVNSGLMANVKKAFTGEVGIGPGCHTVGLGVHTDRVTTIQATFQIIIQLNQCLSIINYAINLIRKFNFKSNPIMIQLNT